MENPIKMDDLGGFPIIFGSTSICYMKVTPTNIDGFVDEKLGLDLDLAIHGGHFFRHAGLLGIESKESSTNLWSIPIINIYHKQKNIHIFWV